MYVTRPYFRGYSTLSKIVDKQNTIENVRKNKENKKLKNNISSKKTHENMYKIGPVYISKVIVDSFHKNGDIFQTIRSKNKSAKKIIDINSFINELINDCDYKCDLSNLLKLTINKHIDSSLYIDIKNELLESVAYSRYIRSYKIVYNRFLNNELKSRRSKNNC